MNTKSLGVLCLCGFLILFGVLSVTNISFVFSAAIVGLLAIAAGILILLGR